MIFFLDPRALIEFFYYLIICMPLWRILYSLFIKICTYISSCMGFFSSCLVYCVPTAVPFLSNEKRLRKMVFQTWYSVWCRKVYHLTQWKVFFQPAYKFWFQTTFHLLVAALHRPVAVLHPLFPFWVVKLLWWLLTFFYRAKMVSSLIWS